MTRCVRPNPAVVVFAVLAAVIAPAAAQSPSYRAGLGDLMTAYVQPRHAKLGFAGREENWPYAAYEAHELQETVERIAKAVPKYREFSIPDLIGSTVTQPLQAAERAAKADDVAGFATAYEQLTAACNTCHQSTGHAEIVIQAPTAPAFPNQDFRPPRR